MKIILSEDRANGAQAVEQTFDKNVIAIGRDAFECDIAFDGERYPMVSRKHAELQWHDGIWFLVDLNSSYGTLLNGQQIQAPMPLVAGNHIQIGQSGPVLKVVWFEVAADSVQGPNVGVPVVAGSSAVHSAIPARTPVSAAIPAAEQRKSQTPATLEFVPEGGRQPFTITGRNIWLGRDPSCEIVFEASAVMVSRRHAQVRAEHDGYVLEANNSFTGTLVNGQRISSVTPLYHGDEIQLGLGGPVLRFDSPARVAPVGASLPGQRSVSTNKLSSAQAAPISSKTMVFKMEGAAVAKNDPAQAQLLMSLTFNGKKELSIGRSEGNDIKLDGLQISNRHARLLKSGGEIVIDDFGSTNGVYVNGRRVSRQTVTAADAVQIGSFVLRVDASGNVGVFDTRSKTRIDAVNLSREVKS